MTEQPSDNQITLEQIAQQLDSLVQSFEQHPNIQVRNQVMEMLALIDTLHRPGLQTLVTALQQQPQLFAQLLTQPAVTMLLTLYDLMPPGPAEQVVAVFEMLGPYLATLGCSIEVLDMADGVVHIALERADNDATPTKEQLVREIETALREHVEGFHAVELHEQYTRSSPAHAQSFIPLQQIKHRGRSKSV